jgi:peptidoglycan/LPS O-acetylase OafA/YrhL
VAAQRNQQLDGWRAFAVVGVMWVHWSPRPWHNSLPFELGLFYFLTLTGFLLTRILLRERTIGEASPGKWRWSCYFRFQKRRMTRILVPCYAAMLFAIAVGAQDIRQHPFAYFLHWANFHIAYLPDWPPGTSHYWTLAVQVQFYLVWPLVVLLVPRRWLGTAMLACVAMAPISRYIIETWFLKIIHDQAIPSESMDYFGCGALLALAMERGMPADDRRLRVGAWLAFAGYAILYVFLDFGRPVPVLEYFKQTLISIAFAGLIAASMAGFHGIAGKILEHPAVQRVAQLSFGLYLFHTPVPLLVGFVLPWLWAPALQNFPGELLKVSVFSVFAWCCAVLSWKYLENGTATPTSRATGGSPDR